MRSGLALLALLSACGFSGAPGNGPDGGGGNPGSDSGGTTSDGPFCYGAIVRVCFDSQPTQQLTVNSATPLNTDTDSLCDKHNDQMANYCVVPTTSFTIMPSGKIAAVGSKPLVLLATGAFDLSGTIDVSSHRTPPAPQTIGAGAALAALCPGTKPADGISGGFGGSFGTQGSDGGDGKPGSGAKGQAGPALKALPAALRGGCQGGAGGNGVAGAGTGGMGGAGGGAVAIVAMSINANGQINASGQGGEGGHLANQTGGGGGGTGGMIVLDAPASMITQSAGLLLWANGGAGGQGSDVGHSGEDGGESSAPATAAIGQQDPLNAGAAGGNGFPATGNMLAPSMASNGGGGGGGGGGAGFIYAPGVTGSQVSPAPSPKS